jgi:DNA-directed RNA polymerase subunit RPC12/RpoP
MALMSIAGDLTGIGRCPHCAVANPQMKVVWTAEAFPQPDTPSAGHNWGACQCTSCSNLILVKCKRTVRGNVIQAFPKIWPSIESFQPPKRLMPQSLNRRANT